MAGKKTQSQLTPEEKLQQALVPEAEQPYKIPDNWCWLHLLDSFINCTDSNKKIKQKEYLKEGILPIVDQGKDLIGGFTNNKEIAFKGDLPVIIFGDHTRCVKYVNFTFVQGADGVKVLKPHFFYNEKLFYYALKNIDIKNLGYRRHFPTFDQYYVPIPPIAEQQRIVERIESLFGKLDEAKENLQNVLDGLKNRKSAILHKAFIGELTSNWRKQHGISMDSWEEKKLGDCGSLQRGRSKHRPRNDSRLFGEKYPFIQTGDVANAEMYIINHSKMLSDFGLQQSKLFPKGTLCITIAANIGKVGILTYDCCFPDSVVGFLPNNENICEFIYYKLTTLQKELEELAPATAQKNINLKLLNDLKINMPTRDEQIEIVRIIDYLFAKEQQAKELAEKAIAKIDLIKKAILARAFRGELGTNNPADEPAIELLKRVL